MLSSVELRRANAILKDTIEKLGFLESITPDVLQHRDELSKFVGDEISRIILEQRALEQRYEALIAQRGALKGLANKSRYKEVQNDIQDVSRALRESTKNLCRNLKDNPNISGNLLKIQRDRRDLIVILKDTLCELSETGSFSALARTVADDRGEQNRLNDIIERERDMSDAVKQYDRDLALERVAHLGRVAEDKAHVAKLKQQLQAVKIRTAMDAKYFRKEAHAHTCSTLRAYAQAERAQETATAELERRKSVEQAVNDATVVFLKSKQKQLADDLGKWEKKFDVDHTALEADLERLTQKRVANLERLTFLQKRRDDELEVEKLQRDTAAKQAAADKVKHAEDAKRQQAAKLVQTVVRIFLRRKAEDDSRRASEKKKKGGKKGKK
ncbi:hypothetical protein M885DRAFT_470516 [Pelagophyceae sp. CCMP2097]|nr:hypothetical protein M885DRAFT_470516 [Pelagophyceae sp. CCMP2097]